MNWLLVALGGAIGAPLRYLTDRTAQTWHQTLFPWGTFTVNVAGSLVLGVLAGAAVSSPAYALLGTGLCGALTTYSTFSYEVLRLAERGKGLLAGAYVTASVLVGLGAVWAGWELGAR
ncbi:fluoride efflux transporter CrcB [Streptomyces sp. NBC_01498]|uniref:fluoride efflux transporter CrcB n=1 Tax=Streptomyces sp. NBC_01498 TaxID=2975870 RepID=UPI002E7C5273|nr:fluoride efflux transporter CrcB [Streptomyces sp. NBC_01498]WTL26037.1 fluoride efflux transporter CrcB [Streptomyces sp. NBC_01498]